MVLGWISGYTLVYYTFIGMVSSYLVAPSVFRVSGGVFVLGGYGKGFLSRH